MSVLWSMRRDGTAQPAFAPDGVRVSVAVDDVTRSFRWLPQTRDVRFRELRRRFYGDFFERPTFHPGPAVLLFGGSEGGLATFDEARLLASRGFPTLALAYFKEPGLPQTLSRIPLEYFARAARWLALETHEPRVVVYGVSRGSEAALLLGVDFPQLVRGVVALVPSNVVLVGHDSSGPAWTLRGRPIPFQYALGPTGPAPIPVERIRVPLFMDCGGLDDLWPSCPMARALARRHRGTTDLLVFRNGGHGVGDLVPNVPQHYQPLEGATALSNARARVAGWPKLLRFLRRL
jgi:pimeloyl-ACP methyl ester carboxylesterase